MNVKKYKARVKSITNPIKDIYSVEFESLGKRFKYHPGQFLHLAIDDEYDGIGQWPDSRCFSMQSNPSENIIKITYAVKGQFTGKMKSLLRVGRKVWLKLPYGDIFQKPYDKNNCVFIAGGTGITPFVSLFTDESFKNYKNPILYAGFRNNNYNIFNDELEKAKLMNNEFIINIVFQDKQGVLDIEKIHNKNKNKTYFISGPPLMINNFKKYLVQKGVMESKIVTDNWE